MKLILRYLLGSMLLAVAALLGMMIGVYALAPFEIHDYQWHITAPVFIALVISG